MVYWKDKHVTYSNKFLKKYGTDEQCILKIINIYFPNSFYCKRCEDYTTFYPIKRKTVKKTYYKQWNCGCGFSFSPIAHTIFNKTVVSFSLYLKMMYILCNYGDVSLYYLRQELLLFHPISYKTIFRMKKIIRKVFLDKRFFPLIDELTEKDPIIAYQETQKLKHEQAVKTGMYGRMIQLGLIQK